MLPTCSDDDLDRLGATISAMSKQPIRNVGQIADHQATGLAIKNLKRFLTTDARKLIQWAYNILQESTSENGPPDTDMIAAWVQRSPVNVALVEFLAESIGFCEAINDSVLDTLFDLAELSVDKGIPSLWLVRFVCEKLPSSAAQRFHEYLILQFAQIGNPHISGSDTINDRQLRLTTLGTTLFSHLLQTHSVLVQQSLLSVLDAYIEWINASDESTPDAAEDADMDVDQIDPRAHTLSYMLSLPKISPDLTSACWGNIIQRLLKDDVLGTIFMHERDNSKSLVRTVEGDLTTVSAVFPTWLYRIAFDRSGVIMKHALDIAIILDTMAHNPRLGLEHLMPSGERSILDSLRPTFEQLSLEPASIDLVDWVVSILSSESSQRQKDGLKIPLFLLQLVVLKNNEPAAAIDTLVQLITKITRSTDASSTNSDNNSRYIILTLVAAACDKWPDVFTATLERIFSKAIATHIANSAGAVNVEKTLANISLLFEEGSTEAGGELSIDHPGFVAFRVYIIQHWRQVLLLFVNHTSMECRALGYRMLTLSRLWEYDASKGSDQIDPDVMAKLLTDTWFRHMKHRYLYFDREKESLVLDEFENLVVHCCQNAVLAKSIHACLLEAVLGGALEIFPTVDLKALQTEKKSLLAKIGETDFQQNSNKQHVASTLAMVQGPIPANQSRPPQFLVTPEFLRKDLEIQDRTYIDNIERTARLFYKFQEHSTSQEQIQTLNMHILSCLSFKWPSSTAAWQAYDNALPRNIPSDRDIEVGGAFKDHPVLFLILDKCSVNVRFPIDDTLRSILVYFIAFWHMSQVALAPTALKFATQLEETIQLIMLFKRTLPSSLLDIHHLLPFMSAQDVGSILYQVIWPYVRSQHPVAEIPGLVPTVPQIDDTKQKQETESKCLSNLASIYQNRLAALQPSPSWHRALEKEAARIGIFSR